MKDKPISPVIVTFKELPGVRVQAIKMDALCRRCRLIGSLACPADSNPNGNCADLDYIWREVPPKEPK